MRLSIKILFILLFALIALGVSGNHPPVSAKAEPQKPVEEPVAPSSWDFPARYRGQVISKPKAKFDQKVVAITFDDGPNKYVTPKVLEILKQYKVKGTFFVLGGFAKNNKEVLKQVFDEGHAIGNHTWGHPMKPDANRAKWEFELTDKLITEVTGKETKLFRPPYGYMKSQAVAKAKSSNDVICLWSVSSGDTSTKDPNQIAYNVLTTTKPGSIILLHDGIGHTYSADALKKIIPELLKKGYKFVTIPELLTIWDEFENGKEKEPAKDETPQQHGLSNSIRSLSAVK